MGESAAKVSESVTYLRYEGNPVTSERTLLAVALLTLGVLPHGAEWFVQTMDMRAGDESVLLNLWTFQTKSRDGKQSTAKLIEQWDDPAWLLAHPMAPLTTLRRGLASPDLLEALAFSCDPESPYAYLSQGLANLARVRASLANVVPLIKITKAGRNVWIPADATDAHHAKMMALFDRK
jgi:hypothetical protein